MMILKLKNLFCVTFLDLAKFEGNSKLFEFHGEEVQRVDQPDIVCSDDHNFAPVQKKILRRNIKLSRKQTRQNKLAIIAEKGA